MAPSAFETHDVYNQTPPLPVRNLFETDPILYGAIEPAVDDVAEQALSEHGAFWGTIEARELARLANANPPVFRPFDAGGRRIEVAEYHPAYHALMRRSAEAGLGIAPLDAENADEIGRAHTLRAARLYIAAAVEPGHLIPWASTLAAASVLVGGGGVSDHWIDGLLARRYDHRQQPAQNKSGLTLAIAWTEKQGGLAGVDTDSEAEPTGGGRYSLTGHKWSVSGPMADATVVLADAPGGVSAFLVPRLKADETLNANRLQRLKAGIGCHANAVAEVEHAGAEAWLVGEEGQGSALFATALQSLRADAAVIGVGLMRGAMSHAVHHARHRKVSGARLVDQALCARVLADATIDISAATALAMRVAQARDRAGQDPIEEACALLLAPAAAYWVGRLAPCVAAECLEVMGGNGYALDGEPGRFYRDAPAFGLWVGGGNALALEVAGILERNPDVLEAVLADLQSDLGPEANLAADVVRGVANACRSDRGAARLLAEQLAMVCAAAAMHRFAPRVITEAFVDSRLGGTWRAGYGMVDGRFDPKGIVDYAYPGL